MRENEKHKALPGRFGVGSRQDGSSVLRKGGKEDLGYDGELEINSGEE